MADWKGFFDGAKKLGKVLVEGAVRLTRHQEITQLLILDRATGKNHISRMVQAMSEAELDDYERQFLEIATTTVVNPDHRRRAMELYAWLKISELAHYQEFRGFVGNG
jgi:hypothetical protein